MAEKIYDGSNLRIKIANKFVYHATDSEISIELSTRERTSKDIEGLQTAPDIISWSASGSALMVKDLPDLNSTHHNFEGLFDAMLDKTLVDVEFTLGDGGTTGDKFYKGQAYISNLSANATNREDATASYSLTGSGVPVKDTIA